MPSTPRKARPPVLKPQPQRPDKEILLLPENADDKYAEGIPFDSAELAIKVIRRRVTAGDRDLFMQSFRENRTPPAQPPPITISPTRCQNLPPTPRSSQSPPAEEVVETSSLPPTFSQADGENEPWSISSSPALPPTPRTPRRRNEGDTGGTLSLTSSPVPSQEIFKRTTSWHISNPEKELSGPQSQSLSQRRPPTKRKVTPEFTKHGATKYARPGRGPRSKKSVPAAEAAAGVDGEEAPEVAEQNAQEVHREDAPEVADETAQEVDGEDAPEVAEEDAEEAVESANSCEG